MGRWVGRRVGERRGGGRAGGGRVGVSVPSSVPPRRSLFPSLWPPTHTHTHTHTHAHTRTHALSDSPRSLEVDAGGRVVPLKRAKLGVRADLNDARRGGGAPEEGAKHGGMCGVGG